MLFHLTDWACLREQETGIKMKEQVKVDPKEPYDKWKRWDTFVKVTFRCVHLGLIGKRSFTKFYKREQRIERLRNAAESSKVSSYKCMFDLTSLPSPTEYCFPTTRVRLPSENASAMTISYFDTISARRSPYSLDTSRRFPREISTVNARAQ